MTIVIADDHPVVLDGLRALFAAEPGFELVAEARDGQEALAQVEAYTPTVLVLDLMMPRLTGLEVVAQLKRRGAGTRVVILSMHASVSYAAQAFKSGALGYVLKSAPSSELLAAVRAAAAGERYVSAALSKEELAAYEARLAGATLDPLETLTAREREVVALSGQGLRTAEVAERLSIGVRTVESHRASAMRKLGIRTLVELARFAISRGLAKSE